MDESTRASYSVAQATRNGLSSSAAKLDPLRQAKRTKIVLEGRLTLTVIYNTIV